MGPSPPPTTPTNDHAAHAARAGSPRASRTAGSGGLFQAGIEGRATPYAIGGSFFLLASLMFFWPGDLDLPDGHTPPVSREDISDRPMRRAPEHPGMIVRGGYKLACSECHNLFASPVETPPQLTQHQHIELDHGINSRCFNCHDRHYREMLVLPGGELIRFDETPRLCATCHGPTYRDWELGIHGRTVGSWDASSGRQSRLVCTQCHDPHAPAFAPMTLLPGPNTIRMGQSSPAGDHDGEHAHSADHGKRNPLRQWMNGRNAAHHDDHGPDDAHPQDTEPQ